MNNVARHCEPRIGDAISGGLRRVFHALAMTIAMLLIAMHANAASFNMRTFLPAMSQAVTQLYQSTDKSDAKALAIAALAGAESRNMGIYQSAKADVMPLLAVDNPSPAVIRAMGLMLYATLFARDDAAGQMIANNLSDALKGESADNPSIAYGEANGYLQAYYAVKNRASYNSESLKKAYAGSSSDMAWLTLIRLNAAALANDKAQYDALVQSLNLSAANNPAWAYNWAAYIAKRVSRDDAFFRQIAQPAQDSLKAATGLDKTMGTVNFYISTL